ncbi:CPBP family intramembrane glutamic endopeptidase [Secundilactobacillus paracollinoides]|uniref:CPBP family intramembrane glutamic endopeptidase n=1 Tax=Secundilactobacillus paracollinoides TaxID=240427 RepID=UPI0009EB4F7B|nr:CPBP family intramembrane glutamic endopeptidase [Secundilactobacillus paracollinoides]
MRKHLSAFLLGIFVLMLFLSSFASVISHLIFHYLSLGSDTNAENTVTELIGFGCFWLLNRFYLKARVHWWSRIDRNWLWGLAFMVVFIGDSTLNPQFTLTVSAILWAIVIGLVVGIFEEYLFRGLVVTYLRTHFGLSGVWTALWSGLIFGLAHAINVLQSGDLVNTIAQILQAFGLGFFLAALYLITNNLWLAIIGHAVIDCFDQLAFGTLSNSAGTSLHTGIIYAVVFVVLGGVILSTHTDQLRASSGRGVTQRGRKKMDFKKGTQEPASLKMALYALLIPIAELILGDFLVKPFHSKLVQVIIVDVIFFIGFLVAIWMFKDVLKRDWQAFKPHFWRGTLLAIGAVVITYILLPLVRSGLGLFLHTSSAAGGVDVLSAQTAGLGVIASLTTLMAPFTEEIIFRHAWFYQWRNRGIVTWLMLILSSIMFGLFHWNNFNGDITQMIPYMVVGAWFGLIYYWSKNIWQNILTHFLFDFVQVLAAVFVLVMTLMHVTG